MISEQVDASSVLMSALDGVGDATLDDSASPIEIDVLSDAGEEVVKHIKDLFKTSADEVPIKMQTNYSFMKGDLWQKVSSSTGVVGMQKLITLIYEVYKLHFGVAWPAFARVLTATSMASGGKLPKWLVDADLFENAQSKHFVKLPVPGRCLKSLWVRPGFVSRKT